MICHMYPQVQARISDEEERSKAWLEGQKRMRREQKSAEQRATQEKLDSMTLEEREEHLREKEEQAKHDKQQSKHLMLLAKSAGTKRGRKKGRKKGRGRSK